MSTMKKGVNPVSFFIVFLLFFTTFGCSDIKYSTPPAYILDYSDVRRYSFDPHTILTRLDQGDEEIFQSISDGSDERTRITDSLGWQPHDYIRVANALNRVANHDDLEGWSIYKLFFTGTCNTTPIGFKDADITYFKVDGEHYVTRRMDISLLEKEADWAGGAVSPRPFFGWKNVDQGKLKVTADDAFQIAEANGAKAIRQAVDNICHFNMIISPNGDFQDWQIQYYGGPSDATLFLINIDPYDGTFEVITP